MYQICCTLLVLKCGWIRMVTSLGEHVLLCLEQLCLVCKFSLHCSQHKAGRAENWQPFALCNISLDFYIKILPCPVIALTPNYFHQALCAPQTIA